VQSVKAEAERSAIAIALEKTGWNRKAAARLLKVSYRTVLYKIEQYKMTASDSSSFPRTKWMPDKKNGYSGSGLSKLSERELGVVSTADRLRSEQ
jgi:transposase